MCISLSGSRFDVIKCEFSPLSPHQRIIAYLLTKHLSKEGTILNEEPLKVLAFPYLTESVSFDLESLATLSVD